MSSKTLGIKVNLQSIGYALTSEENGNVDFIKTGVHYFRGCENPKTKEGLGVKRSEWKSTKRCAYRKKQRKNVLNILLDKYFTQNGFVTPPGALPPLFSRVNIWKERATALNTRKSFEVICQILKHMANHNGFFVHKRLENQDVMISDGKVNTALAELEKNMQETNSRTYGEYISNLSLPYDQKRNKRGEYTLMPRREWLMQEFDQIMAVQKRMYENLEYSYPHLKELHPTKQLFISDKEIAHLREVIFMQRPLKPVIDQVGYCSLFKDEQRCPKFHPLALKFVLISQLQHLKIHIPDQDRADGLSQIDAIQRLFGSGNLGARDNRLEDIWEMFNKKGKITFADLKKILELPKGSVIKGGKKETGTFFEAPQWGEFVAILSKNINISYAHYLACHPEKMEELIRGLSFFYEDNQIKKHIIKYAFNGADIPEDFLQDLLSIKSFEKTINLSLRALQIFLPLMERGLTFKDAYEHLQFRGELPKDTIKASHAKLPVFVPTHNSVVNRACSQARKIINAIINKYGKPDAIRLEIGTELGKSVQTRRQIEKKMRTSEGDKNSAADILREHDIPPSQENILKFRAWKFQNEKDFLTNEPIPLSELFNFITVGMYQICDKDSRLVVSNLMVVHRNNYAHKENLLKELHEKHLANEIEPLFASRLYFIEKFLENNERSKSIQSSMNWVGVALKSFLQESFPDMDILAVPKEVLTSAKLLWNDVPMDNITFQYPVLDAMCLSAIQKKHIKIIQKAVLNEESRVSLGKPFTHDTVIDILSNTYPTVQLEKKVKGETNQQTLMRIMKDRNKKKSNGERITFPKVLEEGKTPVVLKRISLEEITRKNINKIWNFKYDSTLRAVLEERLEEFDWNAEKAFKEPIFSRGTSIRIRRVRIYDDSRVGVKINNGFANYGDMSSVYIYKKEDRYYGSSIYAMDSLTYKNNKKKDPNFKFPTMMIDHKDEIAIDDAEFIFSLVKGEYVSIVSTVKLPDDKVGSKVTSGYYRGYNRSTNTLMLIYSRTTIYDINLNIITEGKIVELISAYSIGPANIIQKYFVDPLGETHLVTNCNQLEIGRV